MLPVFIKYLSSHCMERYSHMSQTNMHVRWIRLHLDCLRSKWFISVYLVVRRETINKGSYLMCGVVGWDRETWNCMPLFATVCLEERIERNIGTLFEPLVRRFKTLQRCESLISYMVNGKISCHCNVRRVYKKRTKQYFKFISGNKRINVFK